MKQMQIVAVTGPLGGGMGKIKAEHPMDEASAQEYAAESLIPSLETVEPGAPTVCIDGRVALQMLNGAEVKRGLKSGGGNSTPTLFALEAVNHFDTDMPVYEAFATVINELESHEQPVGFHTDSNKAEQLKEIILQVRADIADMILDEALAHITDLELPLNATGCGALDGLPAINGKASRNSQRKENGELETVEEVNARLDHLFTVSNALADEPVTRAAFDVYVDGATAREDQGTYAGWNPVKALLVADKVLMDLAVDDGVLSRIQVLEDDGHGEHGHTEDAIAVIKSADQTIETDNLYNRTGSKSFVVNTPVASLSAEALDQPQVEHGIHLYQVATQVHLTDGSQPAILLA